MTTAFRNKRIAGLRHHSKALQIPVATLNELARLRELTSTVRGFTPLDDPARQAIKPFGELLHKTITDYDAPVYQIERLMGLSHHTLRFWLARHGYTDKAPSQHRYEGVELEGQPKVFVLGGQCSKGHDLTEETLRFSGGKGYCLPCMRERQRRQYDKHRDPNRRPHTNWRAVVGDLKERPGEWVKVHDDAHPVTASYLRREYGVETKRETVNTDEGSRIVVHARWVGEPNG